MKPLLDLSARLQALQTANTAPPCGICDVHPGKLRRGHDGGTRPAKKE